MSILGYLSLAFAGSAAIILVRYLIKKPPLDLATKLWLFVGLGLLPGGAATSSTAAGVQGTTQRRFCGSCHIMGPYVADAENPASQSLAARHGRNPFFGAQNCYTCHADYGMFGYPLTKLQGMNHVYEYYLGGWGGLSLDEALAKIHLRKPYDNLNCRQCHTGTLADWGSVPEHVALQQELASNAVSCASSGCHGYAHPFTKDDGDVAPELPRSAIGSDRPAASVSSALSPELAAKVEAEKKKLADAAASARAAEAREKEAAREAARKAAERRSGAPPAAPTIAPGATP
jgi:cytochrome c-type protein NapC